MTLKLSPAFLKCLLFLVIWHETNGASIVCYYESWTSYEGINPGDLDPHLCTHMNYAFIGLNNDGTLKPDDKELDINKGLYFKLTDLKKQNSKLKVLLSVGGASGGRDKIFSAIAKSSEKRAAFIKSTTDYLTKYRFDGLDVDWEYPEKGDKENFITLLSEIKNAFKSKKWLLTAAVASSPAEHGYDVGQLNKYLDLINIMSYDMYGGEWSKFTGQNSALFPSSKESDWERKNLNLAASAKNWNQAGASKKKLVMGTAFYGRSFTLKDSKKHGVHDAVTGNGVDKGYVLYSAICSKYKGWTRVWDDEQKNPYIYKGNQWIGYDDKESIAAKTNWIKKNGYSGIMIWPVDGDDIKGKCGEKQILLKEINRVLGNKINRKKK